MAQKKSKLAKAFIYLTLIAIIFASFAVYLVMYAWISNSNKNPCEEWYILNTETWECEEESTITETNNTTLDEISCNDAGWTWYAENNICILPNVQ